MASGIVEGNTCEVWNWTLTADSGWRASLAKAKMLNNDQELEATLQRIRQFQDQLTHLRKMETNPTNYQASAALFAWTKSRIAWCRSVG